MQSDPERNCVIKDIDGKLSLALLLATAKRAAQQAANLQMHRFGNGTSVILDNRVHDLKIDTDHDSETAICDVIRSQFPDHAVVSEESGASNKASRFTWIIDPLDGTVNYYFGLPYFCTCVACYYTPGGIDDGRDSPHTFVLDDGKPLVGVVYAPFFDWMFCAAAGQGATFNGLPVQNGQNLQLEDALVGISFGSRAEVIDPMGTLATVLARRAKKIRMFGATGFDLALVAKGSLSALVQLHVNIWDFAAASVILSESGVLFHACRNTIDGWCVIAAPPSLFQPLKSLVDGALADNFS